MSATTADPPAPAQESASAPRQKPGPLLRLAQAVASLRLTVVLFVLSFLLVFLGTLAQIDLGIGTVTTGYFRSWICFIPFQVFIQFGQKFFSLPASWRTTLSFPYPAGLTLGTLLMINLLAAHALRFKLSWQRSGVLVTHAGLIILLLGEFITAFAGVEGRMIIEEGERCDTVINLHKVELAVISPFDKDTDTVTTVPGRLLRRVGTTITHDDLPFDIVPVVWHVNSDIRHLIEYTPPDKWEAMRRNPTVPGVEVLGRYAIDPADPHAEASVSLVTGAGGDRLENINRWRGQVGLDPLARAPAPIPVNVGGVEGEQFDFKGEKGRMLLVVARKAGLTWYFKLTASAQAASRNEKAFAELVASASFPENKATVGMGLDRIAVGIPEVAGTASEQKVDAPSMYATLIDKKTDKEIGTYLFTSILRQPQKIMAGGKEYEVSLRFAQTRRPFSLYLKEFRFDRYPGTETALNFSSLVRLVDQETGDDRDVLIRMNEPLRHRGETFFQSGWNEQTEKGTQLQVVRNPGWQLPYWACAIVSLGLCIHFGIVLSGFLGRKGA